MGAVKVTKVLMLVMAVLFVGNAVACPKDVIDKKVVREALKQIDKDLDALYANNAAMRRELERLQAQRDAERNAKRKE
jgi:cell division protein FtsB